MKTAFLGLGTMGAPMAANIARRGHPIVVWNRTAARVEAARGECAALQQATPAPTPAEAVADAEAVCSMLSDPPALAAVLEGPSGAIAHMRPGATLIEMSTVDPATTRRVAAAARQRGLRYLDAPVIGSRGAATDGTLLVLAAGDPADIERVRPVLESMGHVVHAGRATGDGASLKLVANALGAHMVTGFGAVLVLARRLGLDPALVVDTLVRSAFGSPVYAHRGPKILAGDFRPDFTVRLAVKDWELALRTAAEVGYEMPTLAACLEIARRAVAEGHGDEDLAAVIRPFEAQAGVEARRRR